MDDRIAGAVITFQDIDPLKRGLDASEEAREYAEALIETVREPLVVLDADLRVQRATTAFYETFLVSREETEGRFLYDLGNGQWNRPRLRELLGSALFRSEAVSGLRSGTRFSAYRPPDHAAERAPDSRAGIRSSGAFCWRSKTSPSGAKSPKSASNGSFETAKDGIVVLDAETEIVQDVNPFFAASSRDSSAKISSAEPVAGAGELLGHSRSGQQMASDPGKRRSCATTTSQIQTRDGAARESSTSSAIAMSSAHSP